MPDDLNWTDAELRLTPKELYRRLRREAHWAEHDVGEELKAKCDRLEKKKVEEWQRKELAFVNWMEAELAVAFRNGEDPNEILKLQEEFLPHPPLPITGPTPWYRKVSPDDEEQITKEEVGILVEGVGDQRQELQRTTQV